MLASKEVNKDTLHTQQFRHVFVLSWTYYEEFLLTMFLHDKSSCISPYTILLWPRQIHFSYLFAPGFLFCIHLFILMLLLLSIWIFTIQSVSFEPNVLTDPKKKCTEIMVILNYLFSTNRSKFGSFVIFFLEVLQIKALR